MSHMTIWPHPLPLSSRGSCCYYCWCCSGITCRDNNRGGNSYSRHFPGQERKEKWLYHLFKQVLQEDTVATEKYTDQHVGQKTSPSSSTKISSRSHTWLHSTSLLSAPKHSSYCHPAAQESTTKTSNCSINSRCWTLTPTSLSPSKTCAEWHTCCSTQTSHSCICPS